MTNIGPSRNLVGYGANPPHPKWPGQARIAVQFVVNYEEGSEYSVLEGAPHAEKGLADVVGGRTGPGTRDLAIESMYEFGSRVGIWRIFRLFQDRGLPLTVFGCAEALQKNPALVEALMAANYDICCHGLRWIEQFKLDRDAEKQQIEQAVALIQDLTGEAPAGWYCRYGPSIHTRELLAEIGGFLYDSDTYNDELPYWLEVRNKPHLVIPYSLDTNDVKFGPGGGAATADDFFSYLKDGFDLLYEEGAHSPKMLSIGLHSRLIGRPSRAAGLARFMDHIMTRDRVWICRRVDIARHWITTHPPIPAN